MPLWTREQSWRIHQALGLWTNSPGLPYFLDGFSCPGHLWDPGASRDSKGRGEGPGGASGHLVPSPRLLGLAGDSQVQENNKRRQNSGALDFPLALDPAGLFTYGLLQKVFKCKKPTKHKGVQRKPIISKYDDQNTFANACYAVLLVNALTVVGLIISVA